MTKMIRIWTIVLTLLLVSIGVYAKNINFSKKDHNGKLIQFSDLKGKYIHLDFSATWCRPCHYQAKYMHTVEEKLKGKNFISITILTDLKPGDSRLKRWAKEYKAAHVIPDQDRKIASQFTFPGIPHNVIIKPDGTVAGEWSGAPRSADGFITKVKQLAPEMFNSASQKIQTTENNNNTTTSTDGKWNDSYYSKYDYKTFANFKPAQQKIDFNNIDYPLLQAAIFYETNKRRTAQGLPAFKFHKSCRGAAQMHSNDMVKHKFFSHTSPVRGRRQFTDRLALAGLPKSKMQTGGENIADAFGKVYDGKPVRSFEELPAHTYLSFARDLLTGWMNSPGHRRNILRKAFTHLGTGAAPYLARAGLPMFKSTQVFATPR